jgi:hypothetical protein
VRHRQFDDASDATGPEMMVRDDEFHCDQCPTLDWKGQDFPPEKNDWRLRGEVAQREDGMCS